MSGWTVSDNAHNYQLGYVKGLADGRKETAQQAFDWIFERWNLDLGNKDRSLAMFLKQTKES